METVSRLEEVIHLSLSNTTFKADENTHDSTKKAGSGA